MPCSLLSNFGSPLFLDLQSLLETVSYKQEQRSRGLLKPEWESSLGERRYIRKVEIMAHKIGQAMNQHA